MEAELNEHKGNHSVNQACEHRLSRLEYALFDKRRGVIKSLEEGVSSFKDLQKENEKLSKRISVFEGEKSNRKFLDKLLVRLAACIVIIIELLPIVLSFVRNMKNGS